MFDYMKINYSCELADSLVVPAILITVIPVFFEVPLMANLPFFSLTTCGFCISTFCLAFTSYAVTMSNRE